MSSASVSAKSSQCLVSSARRYWYLTCLMASMSAISAAKSWGLITSLQHTGDHVDQRASFPAPIDGGPGDHLRQHHTPQRGPNDFGHTGIRRIFGYQPTELADRGVHFEQMAPRGFARAAAG